MLARGSEHGNDEGREASVAKGKLCIRLKSLPKAWAGQKAGLRVGDYIVAIDEGQWLEYLFHRMVKGERITLTVVHDGRRKRLQLKAP